MCEFHATGAGSRLAVQRLQDAAGPRDAEHLPQCGAADRGSSAEHEGDESAHPVPNHDAIHEMGEDHLEPLGASEYKRPSSRRGRRGSGRGRRSVRVAAEPAQGVGHR